MKTTIRLLAILAVAVLTLSLFGCSFIISEEEYLTNPTESTSSTTTTAADTDSTDDEGAPSSSVSGTTTTKGQQSTAKNVEPKLSGTLEIQCFTNENKQQAANYTDTIKKFEEATGVKVTAHIGSQVNSALSKRWMSDNPVDIAYLSGANIPDVALEAAGLLYDCTDLVKNGYVYGTDDKIWDVTNHEYHQVDNGKIYRPATGASTYGMFYDAAYLKELGLTAPTNYTELMDFSDKAIAKGKAVFTTYGTTGSYSTWSMIIPAVAAYGQDFLQKILSADASAWKSANMKSVLQRWYDFCNKDGVMLKGTATYDHTTAQMKWLKHDALLIGNGTWLPWEMETATPASFEMTYTASPMILDTQKPTVVIYPSMMIIPKNAKNLENAKAYVRFLYTKEAQAPTENSLGGFGIRTDVDYANYPSSVNRGIRQIQQYMYSGKAQWTYRNRNWGALNDTVNGVIHGLMTGSMTVDQAVEKVASRA